jgi:hypothetical protein
LSSFFGSLRLADSSTPGVTGVYTLARRLIATPTTINEVARARYAALALSLIEGWTQVLIYGEEEEEAIRTGQRPVNMLGLLSDFDSWR